MILASDKQQATSSKQNQAIAKFTDLKAWQEGHRLVLDIYRISKSFPSNEQFGLTNQIRRAIVSVTSNLAEGFSRVTANDKMHFYTMAQGSLTETQNQLLIAKDIGYINPGQLKSLANQSVQVHKFITGLIKSLKNGKGVSKNA